MAKPATMSGSKSNVPLSRDMFQHFAVITVFVTTCIAVFADGQGDNVLGKAVAAREVRAEAAVVDAARRTRPNTGLSTKIHDARHSYVPLGAESEGDNIAYGQPMDSASGSGGGSSSVGYARPAPRALATASAVPVGAAQPAAPRDPRASTGRQQPSSQERAKLEADSLARSGDRGED
jgi:hypothetical protein